jgi:aryl-alcohol dehydrogenase-like predicted oxidoreductase
MGIGGSGRSDAAHQRAVELAGERRLGLGCMALTGIYGPIPRAQAINTLHMALDRGISLFDTAPLYGSGANEELLGDVLGNRFDITLVTKFGLYVDPEGRLFRDSRPSSIRASVEASLKRLRRDSIDLLLQHRPDLGVPPADVAACVDGLMAEGKVKAFGLSCVPAEAFRSWSGPPGLIAVQNELSAVTGEKVVEVAAAEEEGIAYMAFSPLGRGLLANSQPASEQDLRSDLPGFVAPSNDVRARVAALRVASVELSVAAAALAISWVLNQGRAVVAIPGCRSPRQVDEITSSGGSAARRDLLRMMPITASRTNLP